MLSGGLYSGGADDEGAGGGFDDVVGDGVEFVDLQDPLDLGEEAFEEPEVAAGDPCDGCDGLGVGEVVGVEGLAEGSPVSLEDEQQFVLPPGAGTGGRRRLGCRTGGSG